MGPSSSSCSPLCPPSRRHLDHRRRNGGGMNMNEEARKKERKRWKTEVKERTRQFSDWKMAMSIGTQTGTDINFRIQVRRAEST